MPTPMDKNTVISAISQYQPILMAETPASAAVLVILMYDEQDNLFLIITKRSNHVATYAGDYCFPGGMRESTDQAIKITAMREVEEELGLKNDSYQMIGQLDDFIDRYERLVRPFVAIMSKKKFEQHYKNNSDEIRGIYFFPLEDLLTVQESELLSLITKRHPSYFYLRDEVMIWGLTASIMVHLGNIIYGLNKSVGKGLV